MDVAIAPRVKYTVDHPRRAAQGYQSKFVGKKVERVNFLREKSPTNVPVEVI
jgi:hypothetical protein